MRIVVTEHPKSGGNWLVGLLGDILGLPKRDIYISDEYRVFDVSKHHWYWGAADWGLPESCVIKSHELPGSVVLTFPARYVHLIRDGRDVAVSKFHYERDFCTANGILPSFSTPFDEYVLQVGEAWSQYVMAWAREKTPVCKYEDLYADPMRGLRSLLEELDLGVPVSDPQIQSAVDNNTKAKTHSRLAVAFRHNIFIRSGIPGEWRTRFSQKNREHFKAVAGEALKWYGYESENTWQINP